ncbi:transcription initiation factor IIA subunit 1-like [Mya arenaria]|uniref:transcription initiation factor IIA subunit 1-like n=1 Tax=Mya arenaria TaxID=6604 RepID=UPI0022E51BFC|nr:transcription initiation factor IIA subunit 1-like [Mya arenaria]
MSNTNSTRKVYMSVVEDVISNVREAFLDEGVDEQVLHELKHLWESKLAASRALEPADPEPQVATQPGGNIPYQLMAPQQAQIRVNPTTIQQQIPVPVQLTDGQQISNAASVAFNAQGGMFPSHQVQTLVNIQGTHYQMQQTANGQYILTLPTGVSQGQMVNLPQQTIIQGQPGQVTQIQGQALPQFDGAHDEPSTELSNVQSSPHTMEQCDDIDIDLCAQLKGDEIIDSLSDNVLHKGEEIELELECSPASAGRLLNSRKRTKRSRVPKVPQLDGNHDTSSSEDNDFDDDDDDNNDDDDEKEDGEEDGEEEEPLNSDDDVSEEDPSELFDTDNVVVCQFEKISRNKGKWKFLLKDGIMNLDGKDHIFQRGTGEADW